MGDPTPPASGPILGRARVYARVRRHALDHLYADCSPQYGPWVGQDAESFHFPASRTGALYGERDWVEARAGTYSPTYARKQE